MDPDEGGYYDDSAYYEDVYYGDAGGYHDNVLESTVNFCVLPVIAQVTAVFLKLFGLAAIVSLFIDFPCMYITNMLF